MLISSFLSNSVFVFVERDKSIKSDTFYWSLKRSITNDNNDIQKSSKSVGTYWSSKHTTSSDNNNRQKLEQCVGNQSSKPHESCRSNNVHTRLIITRSNIEGKLIVYSRKRMIQSWRKNNQICSQFTRTRNLLANRDWQIYNWFIKLKQCVHI